LTTALLQASTTVNAKGHSGRAQPRNTWERGFKKEMWTASYKYIWEKIEVAAQNRAGWRRVVYGHCFTGSWIAIPEPFSQSCLIIANIRLPKNVYSTPEKVKCKKL